MLMAQSRADYLTEYHELAAQIRAIDPKAKIPEAKDIRALFEVRAMLDKLKNPAPRPATPAEKQWQDVNALQNETASRLAGFVQRGVVEYKDFPFPAEELPTVERIKGLNSINARLTRAFDEHSMSPEVRAKTALMEVRRLSDELREAVARISAIEQELSHT